MSCKVVLEAASEFLEGRSTFCRERQHMQRALNFVVGGLALWRLLQNQMGVGAPEAKAAYPRKARLFSRQPWLSLGRDDERSFLQRNVGIQLLKMGLGRDLSVFEAEQHFDQAGHSSGSLQVTDIGLD